MNRQRFITCISLLSYLETYANSTAPDETPQNVAQNVLSHLGLYCLLIGISLKNEMSLVMRKPAFCICENKDADQLRGGREADQRLCFRYMDSTIPLLSKYEISSL